MVKAHGGRRGVIRVGALFGVAHPRLHREHAGHAPGAGHGLIERDYERGELDKLDNYLEHVVIQRDDIALRDEPPYFEATKGGQYGVIDANGAFTPMERKTEEEETEE